MRSVLRIILALLLFAALGAPSATRLSAAQEGKPEAFPSLDALIKQYDPAQCKECHETTHKEWGQSFHARSVLWSLGSLRALRRRSLRRSSGSSRRQWTTRTTG